MSEDEIKARVREIENLIIFSTSRLSYLMQINKLISSKNRIILRHPSFYSIIQRDFSSSAILAVRKLSERDSRTHNINTLVSAIKQIKKYKANKKELDKIFNELKLLTNKKIARDSVIIASINYAHLSIRKPRREIEVRYSDLNDWLREVGVLINKISGILWKSGIVMQLFESEEDSFSKEYEHMEKAELSGTHLLRIDSEHPAVEYANRLLSIKNNSA